MREYDKLVVCAAAAMMVIYLVHPAAIWRITKAAGEWLAVILVLIWGSVLAH